MPDGWAVDHWFELIEVEAAGGELVTNLAVCWGQEVARGDEDVPAGDDEAARLSKMELRGLKVLEAMTKAVSIVPTSGVRWVSIEAWWEELCNQHIIDPDAHRDDPLQRFIRNGVLARRKSAFVLRTKTRRRHRVRRDHGLGG
jgi:hypothetical protein